MPDRSLTAILPQRLRGAAAAAALASLAACGPPSDAVPDVSAREAPEASAAVPSAAAADVLGTIEATVDGQSRTWYVVTGSVRGEPYASAVWFETPDGELIASIGGYDTADLPFDSFETDPARGVSVGDYGGSALTILLQPEGGAEPHRAPVSEDAPGVTWAPRAAADVLSGAYFGRSGTVEVTRLEVVGDRLHAEGTFEASVWTMGDVGPVEITGGRFSVEGVPHRSALGGG